MFDVISDIHSRRIYLQTLYPAIFAHASNMSAWHSRCTATNELSRFPHVRTTRCLRSFFHIRTAGVKDDRARAQCARKPDSCGLGPYNVLKYVISDVSKRKSYDFNATTRVG